MEARTQAQLKALPAIGELLDRPDCRPDVRRPRWALLEAARLVVAEAREAVLAGQPSPGEAAIVERVRDRALELARPRLRRVVNATGVVVHTNLGRAPLAEAAIERMVLVARGYSNLEYDLEQGARGSRHGLVEESLCRLTGADAAMVVNNNAAAVMLALAALAGGREVIVSRGELVEIGGSFRIPDILAQSGCVLREVGTTNRTRIADYERAITERTAVLLKVHPSNFRIVGFTESVDALELAALARRRGLPVVEDLGSGCLVDLEPYGLSGEPTVRARIDAGVDLVTMSGDKLLGGPQAGILAGRGDLIAACRAHPLARALRVDKLTLAALDGTLAVYERHGERSEVPVLAMLTRSAEALAGEAERLRGVIAEAAPGLMVSIRAGGSRVGGGAFPDRELPTTVVAVACPGRNRELERFLRSQDPSIIVRQQEEALLIDPRTLLEGDDRLVVEALRRFCA
jgi:L-seryl-tRNA(Ser) seleniumtransferase